MADDPKTGTAFDPALLDALRQVRELTEDLPAGLRQGIRSAVSRVEDRSHAVGAAEQRRSTTSTDTLGYLLYELMTDAQRLLDLINRHGHLWQPEPGRAHPDVERLPLLAARIVAAAIHQPEETS